MEPPKIQNCEGALRLLFHCPRTRSTGLQLPRRGEYCHFASAAISLIATPLVRRRLTMYAVGKRPFGAPDMSADQKADVAAGALASHSHLHSFYEASRVPSLCIALEVI